MMKTQLFFLLVSLSERTQAKVVPREMNRVMNDARTAIVVIDVQRDFMEGGSLQLPGANYITQDGSKSYLQLVNSFLDLARSKNMEVIWSQDYHPPGHSSYSTSHWIVDASGAKTHPNPFTTRDLTDKITGAVYKKDQMMWPVHCTQGTPGADIVAKVKRGEFIATKGMNKDYDSYSAFEDDNGTETKLPGYLADKGFRNLIIFGLATDYCVKFSANHGVDYGYNVYTIKELNRGTESPDSGEWSGDVTPKNFDYSQKYNPKIKVLDLVSATKSLKDRKTPSGNRWAQKASRGGKNGNSRFAQNASRPRNQRCCRVEQ